MTLQPNLSDKPEADLTVIILTFNEERNVRRCIESVKSIAKDIVVVDSFSTDSTLEIAKSLNVRVIQNKFIHYSQQRNFALKETSIQTEWILMLDADERISPLLAEELITVLNSNPSENGFQVRFQFFWYGRWIKKGYYPVWLNRLARTHNVLCEDKWVNEHLQVEGKMGQLKGNIIHEDLNGIDRWHLKHLKYADLEAREFFRKDRKANGVKRWIHYQVWDRLPLFVRPWFYFGYRYLLRGGFLEGWQGLSFHFFQALWFQFLIGFKITELKQRDGHSSQSR